MDWLSDAFGKIIIPAIVGGGAGYIGLLFIRRVWWVVRGETYDEVNDKLVAAARDHLSVAAWANDGDIEIVISNIREAE